MCECVCSLGIGVCPVVGPGIGWWEEFCVALTAAVVGGYFLPLLPVNDTSDAGFGTLEHFC